MQGGYAKCVAIAVACMLCGGLLRSSPAYAEGKSGYTKRALAWHIGELTPRLVLGQLASMPGQQADREALQRFATMAGVRIPPLPRKGRDPKATARGIFSWERSGPGSALRKELSRRHGVDCGALFELAYASNMLYGVEDFTREPGGSFVTQMRRAFGLSRLKPELIRPLNQRIDQKSAPKDVHMALQRFHRAVRVALKRESGPRIQSPSPPASAGKAPMAWLLGMTACMAAIKHMQSEISGKPPDATLAEMMQTLRDTTASLTVRMPVFPERGTQAPAAYQIKVITYVMTDWGTRVNARLRGKWGPRHAYLFEIPVKAGWLLQGGPAASNEMARLVSNFIKGVAEEAELSRRVWGPFVTMVDGGASGQAVMDALWKMNRAALEHLGGGGTPPKPEKPTRDVEAVEAAVACWELVAALVDGLNYENKNPDYRGRQAKWTPIIERAEKLRLSWPDWPPEIARLPPREQPAKRMMFVMRTVFLSLSDQISKRSGPWPKAVFRAGFSLGVHALAYEQAGYQQDVTNMTRGELQKAELPEELWSDALAAAEKKMSTLDVTIQAALARGQVLNHLKAMLPGVSANTKAPAGAESVWGIVRHCYDWARRSHKASSATGPQAERLETLAKESKQKADAASARLSITLKWPLAQETRYKHYGIFEHVLRFCAKDLKGSARAELARFCEFSGELQWFRLGGEMEAVLGSLHTYFGRKRPMIERQAEIVERHGKEAGVPQHFYESVAAQARRGADPEVLRGATEEANRRIDAWVQGK